MLQRPFDLNSYIGVPYLTPGGQHKFSHIGSTDFLDLPGKSSFDPLRWAVHNDFLGESFLDVVTFYQSWYFFAFVVSFLRIGGVNAGFNDFFCHEGIVTTHRLRSLLLLFRHITRTRDDGQRSLCYRKLEAIIRKVSTVTQTLSFPSDVRIRTRTHSFKCDDVDEDALLIAHAVHLSVVLLAEQLGHAILFYASRKPAAKWRKYLWGKSLRVERILRLAGVVSKRRLDFQRSVHKHFGHVSPQPHGSSYTWERP